MNWSRFSSNELCLNGLRLNPLQIILSLTLKIINELSIFGFTFDTSNSRFPYSSQTWMQPWLVEAEITTVAIDTWKKGKKKKKSRNWWISRWENKNGRSTIVSALYHILKEEIYFIPSIAFLSISLPLINLTETRPIILKNDRFNCAKAPLWRYSIHLISLSHSLLLRTFFFLLRPFGYLQFFTVSFASFPLFFVKLCLLIALISMLISTDMPFFCFFLHGVNYKIQISVLYF